MARLLHKSCGQIQPALLRSHIRQARDDRPSALCHRGNRAMTLSYDDKLKIWEQGRFAPPPEPKLTPATPSLIEMALMRDGIRLYTEVYLPEADGPFPVVFIRSPYPYSRPSRHDVGRVKRYLEAGYAFVYQMTRGQYESEGIFRFHQSDGEDGFDAIGWLAEQTWCDGNVGMEGASYSGKVQILAALMNPPALKCIMPTAMVGNQITCYPFMGGIPARAWWLQWHGVVDCESMADLVAPYGDMSVVKHSIWGPAITKRPLIDAANELLEGNKRDSWIETMSHPLDDAFWAPIHATDEELATIDIPMFFTDGWYDATIGSIDTFERLVRLHPDRSDRYLLTGPWNHYQTGTSALHETSVGARTPPANSAVDLMALRLAFFDKYLKGDKNSIVQQDRARVFITGLDEWRDYPTFPPAAVQPRKLFLHSVGKAQGYPEGGSLSWEAPSDEPVDTYIYDPSLPTPSPPATLAEPIQDFREIEIRNDVLIYTSAPLVTPLTLLGNVEFMLYAASDGRDTDWFATLTEVLPDGRSIPFYRTIGALRARYREGFDHESLLVPNEPTLFHIPLGPVGHRLDTGARLRLSICSAYYPECDPNTNTGNNFLTDTDWRVARQTVFHDALRPTHILLPVLDEIG